MASAFQSMVLGPKASRGKAGNKARLAPKKNLPYGWAKASGWKVGNKRGRVRVGSLHGTLSQVLGSCWACLLEERGLKTNRRNPTLETQGESLQPSNDQLEKGAEGGRRTHQSPAPPPAAENLFSRVSRTQFAMWAGYMVGGLYRRWLYVHIVKDIE